VFKSFNVCIFEGEKMDSLDVFDKKRLIDNGKCSNLTYCYEQQSSNNAV